jgi:hypothetical protein
VKSLLTDIDLDNACKNYVKAAVKGVVKVISKMGISTIQSYRGAQIFEAIGLAGTVVDKYFTWTPSRIEGINLDVIARETSCATNTPSPIALQHPFPRRRRVLPVAPGRRVPPLQPPHRPPPPTRLRVTTITPCSRSTPPGPSTNTPNRPHPARTARLQVRRLTRPHRGGRTRRSHPPPVQKRRHVLWLHQPRGPRSPRHRHEPHRRQEQHRRRR